MVHPSRPGSRWWQAAIILVAAWVAYAPALRGDWLWDDNSEITTNPELRDPAGWWKTWVAPTSPDYFPLKTEVQWLQWRAWGADATLGYHLTNLALHIVSALLFWRLLRRLGLRWGWVGGAWWAVHPLAVESVAWIAELKNTLSLPFCLLAFDAWLDFEERGSRSAWVRAGLLFLAAMLCKSSVAMAPVILLVVVWWRRGRIEAAAVRDVAPFFGIALALGLVTVWFQQHRAIGAWTLAERDWPTRVGEAGLALAFYAGKAVWPAGLTPIYPAWGTAAGCGALVWLGLAGLMYGAWRRRATWGGPVLLGVGCFVVGLLPVLGLIRMSYLRIAPVADHLVYFPLLGLAGLAAAGLEALAGRVGPGLRPAVWGAVAVVLGGFTLGSRQYAAAFAGPEALWTHALAHDPESWIAHNNLGALRLRQGRWADAAAHLEVAVRQRPAEASAQTNLGDALAHLGRPEEALTHQREAVRLEPDSPAAHFNLANTLAATDRLPEALASYATAMQLAPEAADVRYNYANALLKAGRLPEAIAGYREALRLRPEVAEAELNLGNALAASGQMAEATGHFAAAVRLAPASGEARFSLADALAESGHALDALPHFAEAAGLDPRNAEVQVSWGRALETLGRAPEALAHYEEALRLAPGHPEARARREAWRSGSGGR